ncbi:MAG TPA: hypothetical protein VG605_16055, partial [Puia sp.]|nr:hypothetical protein [Puia sp.]
TEDQYKYELADYVAACSAIADRPVPVAYEENALKALIDTYNHCGVVAGSKGRARVVLNILLMGGYLHSNIQPSGNTDAAHAGWPVFYGPIGGVGVLLRPGRGSKAFRRWGVLVDFLYDQFMLNSHRFQKNYYQAYTGKMAFSEVRGNVQLRYSYPVGNFQPFLGVGVSNSLIFNNTSSQKVVDAATSSTIRQPLFGDNNYMISYRPGGFGVVGVGWKRWSLEGRFERTAYLVNTTTGIRASVKNIYALVAFRF